MKILYGIFILSVCFVFAGCAGRRQAEWVSLGPVFNQTKHRQVEVFKSVKEVKRPWGSIGFIYGEYIPASNNKALEKEVEKAKKLAAQNGANAIIIRKIKVDKPKYAKTPHIYIHSTAIKYVDEMTPEDKEAVKKWETENPNVSN